jgi:hypothetical protein
MRSLTPTLVTALLIASLGAGLFVGLSAAAVVMVYRAPWQWALAAGGAGAAACFVWLLTRVISEGKPTPKPKTPPAVKQYNTTQLAVTVQEPKSPYHWGVFMDLPIDDEQLERVCAILNRDPRYDGARLYGPGRPMSRGEFEQVRDIWIQRGIVQWVNDRAHQQGAILSPVGRASVRRVTEMSVTRTRTSVRTREGERGRDRRP